MATQLKLFNRDESQGKKCTRCGNWKILDDFHRSKISKDGHKPRCKECISKVESEYHKRPEVIARLKEYRQIPEVKKRKNLSNHKRRLRPDVKKQEREYQQRPEARAKNKIRLRKYGRSEDGKAAKRRYHQMPHVKERRNKREAERKKTDLKYKLNHTMSTLIGYSLKGKKNGRKWLDLVPYTIDELIKRLKKTLPKGYTWDDFIKGKNVLHIDHIIPVSVFNFQSSFDTDFKRCWSLKNLQLLPAKENISKGAKLTKHFQPSLMF